MKIQVGEMAFRLPNGEYSESIPIYKECRKIPADVAEERFADKAAAFIVKAHTLLEKAKKR